MYTNRQEQHTEIAINIFLIYIPYKKRLQFTVIRICYLKYDNVKEVS